MRTAQLIGWLFLLPALLSFAMFKYYPILLGMFVSFFKVDIVNMPGEFIGFENYIRAFSHPDFQNSMINNVQFFLVNFVMTFWVPILLAVLINEVRRGKAFVRLMYFLPAIAPGIAMTVLWKYIWQPDYGLANFIVRTFGLKEQLWLNDPNLVKWCMAVPGLVMGGGMNMMIYLAALQDVPEEQYEAALLDGAGFFRRVWRIAVPTIKPIIGTVFVLFIIGAFNMFDNVMVMTGGGPSGATETMVFYAYKQAYTFLDYGYAMACATIAFIVVFIFTLIQRYISREKPV